MLWSRVCRSASFLRLFVVAGAVLATGSLAAQSAGQREAARTAMPLVFEENAGQLAAGDAFAGRTQQYALELRRDELRFRLPGKVAGRTISIEFEGSKGGQPEGLQEAGFRTNSYVGSDPKAWRTGIRNYDRVGLKALYPGIDAEFYARDGAIEHDFLVAPGADAAQLKMRLAGAAKTSLTAAGDVEMTADEGVLRLRKPVAYQTLADGTRKAVDARFVLEREELGFALGLYDRSRELVIDPVIVYATFAGGTAGSVASSITTDSAGGVYVSGTTSSTSTVAVTNCATTCTNYISVLKFVTGSSGVSVAWLTYIGEPASGSMTVTSSVANGSAVYVGGYTNSASLASGVTSAVTNPTGGGFVGFVSGLNATNGVLNGTNLVYADAVFPNNNTVEGLALDSSNNLYLTGVTGFASTASPHIAPTANAFAITPSVTAYNSTPGAYPGDAYVAEYPAATPLSGSPAFFTYLHTNALTTSIAVDSNALIYIAGQTTSGFPAPPAPSSKSNTSSANDAFELNFSINASAPPTVSSFTWLNGNGNTTATGLAIDGAGNSYLFGNTLATALGSELGSPTCTLQCTLRDSSGSGYVVALNSVGVATAYTYLGSSGTVDTAVGGTYAGGTVYVTGQTNSPKNVSGTTVPILATSTVQTAVAPFNVQALANGEDLTTTAKKRGYVASLSSGLSAVNYVANIGGSGGSDSAAAIAVDATGDVFVAANIANGSTPYTPYAAYQSTNPATTASSAYLAQISTSTVTTGLTLAKTTGSPSVDPIGYVNASDYSTVTYTWTLTATANVTTNDVVVNVASPANLTFTLAQILDTTAGGTVAGTCSWSAKGASCVVPVFPQTAAGVNDTLSVVVNASVNSTAYTSPTKINIVATAASEASEYATITQSSNLEAASNLVIGMGTPSVTGVYATSAPVYTGTTVTYPITLTNSGATAGTASPAVLTIPTLPAGFTVTAVTAAVTGTGAAIKTCDTTLAATGCSSVTLPATGVLTYSITGYYSDVVVFPPPSVAASVVSGTFGVTATGFLGNVASNSALATNTTITRAVDISTTVAKSNLAVHDGLNPTALKSVFNLSTVATQAPINYVYTIINAGPSIAYNVALTATYPTVPDVSSFVATVASGTDSGGNPVSCTYTTSLSCVVGEVASGTSVTVTLTAQYPDLAPQMDAVPAGAKSNNYSIAGTATTPAYYVKYGTGSLTAVFPATAVTIERTASISVTTTKVTSVAPQTICPSTNTPCVTMYNPSTNLNANVNQYDTASYIMTVTNAGPNATTGTGVTIALPTAPATTGTNPTTHLLTGTATATPGSTPTGWAGYEMTSCTTGTTTVTCGSATTTGTTGIPVGGTVQINLTGTFDPATVPLTVSSVNTSAIPGTATVTASIFAGLPTRPTTLQTYGIVRSSHLVIRKTRNPVIDVPPLSYADQTDPDLDEQTTGTTFGADDEIEYEVAVGNGGANDAPGVTVTDTLQPYFTVYRAYLIASTSTMPDTVANAAPSGTSIGSATCYAGATATGSPITLPYATGATTAQITCVAPASYVLVADKSTTNAPGSSGVELVYQGKFQNNFPAADDIPLGLLLYTVTSNAGDASVTTSLATDYAAGSDELSAALPSYNVQRIPVAPTLVLAPIPNQVYGNAPITVSATSNSAGAITYSIASGNATISGATVTLTGTGMVCVQASQVANGSYAAGTTQQCFTVTQASQTISTTSVVSPVTFGIPPIALNATASSGLTVTYGFVSGPGSLNGSTLTVNGAGTITLVANQAGNANYFAAPQVTLQIVVTKASPVMTWTTPASISYGTALSATQLNAQALGVGGASINGSYTYAPATGAVLGIGPQTLTVTFSPADSTDYQLAYGQVTLVVGKGTAVISLATSGTPVLAQNPVTFTAAVTATGIAPTGNVTFLDGTTTIGAATLVSGTASFTTSNLVAGTHSIAAVYSGDTSYAGATSSAVSETVSDFSLTVTPATQSTMLGGTVTYALTLTAVGASTLGGAVTFTISGLPSGAVATFAPSTVAVGAGTTAVTLTIKAPAQIAEMRGRSRSGSRLAPFALALLLLPVWGSFRKRLGKVSRLGMMLLLIFAGLGVAAGVSGCGTGSPAEGQGTFALTVNATSGALTHAVDLSLTVQ